MEWRNARFNALGTIDMEIEHDVYGWLPFTATPDDPEQRGRDLYAAALESGNVAVYLPAPVSPEQIKAEIGQAVQDRLDQFARSRGYDSIMSAASYAQSSVSAFSVEGQRASTLRDMTWLKVSAILAEVESGARPMPTTLSDIEGDLPSLTWENSE